MSNINFKFNNPIQLSKKKGSKDVTNNCQNGFTYFEQSKTDNNILWGSNKPMKEICTTNYKPHNGTPTHSLWNNMTKRKSIVIKE